MALRSVFQGFLVSGRSAEGAGSGQDTRAAANYAYLVHVANNHSAVYNLEGSHDSTGWMIDSTYTATTSTGTAQVTNYYPYVRVNIAESYSGGGDTAHLTVFYAPGFQ